MIPPEHLTRARNPNRAMSFATTIGLLFDIRFTDPPIGMTYGQGHKQITFYPAQEGTNRLQCPTRQLFPFANPQFRRAFHDGVPCFRRVEKTVVQLGNEFRELDGLESPSYNLKKHIRSHYFLTVLSRIPAVMITGFHHTGITVRNIDRMVAFYTQEIGLKLQHEVDSTAPPEGDHTGVPGARRKLIFVGFKNDHQIELVHYIDPPAEEGYLDKHQLGSMHVCFRVDNLQAVYDRLKEKGVRFATEPKFRDIDGRAVGVVYAQDPEGNWLEFIEGL